MRKMNTECVEVLEWDPLRKKNVVHTYSIGSRFEYSQPDDPLGLNSYSVIDYEGCSSSPNHRLEDGHRYEVVACEDEEGLTQIVLEER